MNHKLQYKVLLALEELMAIRRQELKGVEAECDRRQKESWGQQEPWTYKNETIARFTREKIEPLAEIIRDANLSFDSEKYKTLAKWWRRWMGWCPIQFCMICESWYWGGLPWISWRPWMKDYCSRKCADLDMETL